MPRVPCPSATAIKAGAGGAKSHARGRTLSSPHRLAMLADVEAFALVVAANPEIDDRRSELERDPGAERAPGERHRDADDLHRELPDIALPQPGNAGMGGAGDHRGGGEHPRQQRAEDAADAVDAEHVERIVIAETLLERGRGEIAHRAGDGADDDAL